MEQCYKIASGILIFVAVAILSLAFVLSHNSACGVAPPIAEHTATMKAVVYRCYGSADVLNFETIEKPMPADDEVLVKVRAASVNPHDWHFMYGKPYFLRQYTDLGAPTNPGVGVDFAGTIANMNNSILRIAHETCFGKPEAFVFLSTWGVDEDDNKKLEGRLQCKLKRLFT